MKNGNAILFVLILGCCLTLIACDKVTLPTSDSTPPTLSWKVLTLGNKESTNVPSGGDLSRQENRFPPCDSDSR